MSAPDSVLDARTKGGRFPRAAIFGLAGTALSADEAAFFAEVDPLGFILFTRNCQDPDQVRALVAELRACVGRADAPILIDQEGGRVARLKPPHWPIFPAAGAIAKLYEEDPKAALEAAMLHAFLIACVLRDLGITVNCAPVLDIPQAGSDPIIGDRAFGTTPRMVSTLGRAACDGYLRGGVVPVIKHIPGHGRALVDSHMALPVVDAPLGELRRVDFRPFLDLADMPWAMTAHVVYKDIDPDRPATTSSRILGQVVRGEFGFRGVVLSDDLSMNALGGDYADRARRALTAGCDVVLHCNADRIEMEAVAEGSREMTETSYFRVQSGEKLRRRCLRADGENTAEQWARLAGLLKRAS